CVGSSPTMNIAGHTGTPAGTVAAIATSFIGIGVARTAAAVCAAEAAGVDGDCVCGLMAMAKYTPAASAAVTAANVAAATSGRCLRSGGGACFNASVNRAKKSAEGSI